MARGAATGGIKLPVPATLVSALPMVNSIAALAAWEVVDHTVRLSLGASNAVRKETLLRLVFDAAVIVAAPMLLPGALGMVAFIRIAVVSFAVACRARLGSRWRPAARESHEGLPMGERLLGAGAAALALMQALYLGPIVSGFGLSLLITPLVYPLSFHDSAALAESTSCCASVEATVRGTYGAHVIYLLAAIGMAALAIAGAAFAHRVKHRKNRATKAEVAL